MFKYTQTHKNHRCRYRHATARTHVCMCPCTKAGTREESHRTEAMCTRNRGRTPIKAHANTAHTTRALTRGILASLTLFHDSWPLSVWFQNCPQEGARAPAVRRPGSADTQKREAGVIRFLPGDPVSLPGLFLK
jgi:hypothetical protein